MKVVDIAADATLDESTRVLSNGGVVVLPTDTVYGLAARAGDASALDRLFELKQRPRDLSIAVLVTDLEQALEVAALSDRERAVLESCWPGALTLVTTRRAELDAAIGRADGTVGIRCPNHDFVRHVAGLVGPLATTSANRSGEPTPTTAIAAAEALAGSVPLVVDGGECVGEASTVARVDPDGTVTIFRAGALRATDLEEIAQNLD